MGRFDFRRHEGYRGFFQVNFLTLYLSESGSFLFQWGFLPHFRGCLRSRIIRHPEPRVGGEGSRAIMQMREYSAFFFMARDSSLAKPRSE
jgi:hypothetical protein